MTTFWRTVDPTLFNRKPTNDGVCECGDGKFMRVLRRGTEAEKKAAVAERQEVKNNWILFQNALNQILQPPLNLLKYAEETVFDDIPTELGAFLYRVRNHPMQKFLTHPYYDRYTMSFIALIPFQPQVLQVLDEMAIQHGMT